MAFKRPGSQEKYTPGRRPQDLDRRFDKTQLKQSSHGHRIHRDYAAHFFRWGWATKFTDGGSRILDIGCGQDQPMVKIIANFPSRVPALYVGVDLNKIKRKTKISWAKIYDEFNFVDSAHMLCRFDHGTDFNLITCFEVIEHMHVADGIKLIKNARDLLDPRDPDAVFLMSTPRYDGKRMAANHIHEYHEDELQKLVESCGLEVVRKHGTFSSWNDMKKAVTQDELKLLNELKDFYSWDVLSCFMAPKYPQASRNIAWILRRARNSECQNKFRRPSYKGLDIKIAFTRSEIKT